MFTPPTPASVLATDVAAAGVTQLINFTLASVVDNKFVLELDGTQGSNASFALYSGSTLLQPTTPFGVMGSTVVADYAGLTLGSPYTFKLTVPTAASWKISSLDTASTVAVTAVPEAESTVLALAGAGVVAGLALKRRRRAASKV